MNAGTESRFMTNFCIMRAIAERKFFGSRFGALGLAVAGLRGRKEN